MQKISVFYSKLQILQFESLQNISKMQFFQAAKTKKKISFRVTTLSPLPPRRCGTRNPTKFQQISDKFLTSESSQNISKMQCFSHAAKRSKKFSKLDCSRKKLSMLDSSLQCCRGISCRWCAHALVVVVSAWFRGRWRLMLLTGGPVMMG